MLIPNFIGKELIAQVIDPDFVCAVCKIEAEHTLIVCNSAFAKIGAGIIKEIAFGACQRVGRAFPDGRLKSTAAGGNGNRVLLVSRNGGDAAPVLVAYVIGPDFIISLG